MKYLTSHRFATALALLTAAGLLAPAPSAGGAQASQSGPGAIQIELDIEQLINDQEVFSPSVPDEVWKIDAAPGRQLLRLPLTIKPGAPGSEPAELKTTTISVRGARFIAWLIMAGEEDEQLSDDRSGNPRRNLFADAQNVATAIEPGAPTITQKLTVTPDGRIRWGLDRKFRGATLDKDSLYALLLDARLMNAQAPSPPQRIVRNANQDGQSLKHLRQEEMARYRRDNAQFSELRKQVRALPRTFEQTLPSVLWAVFDAPLAMTNLSVRITGNGGAAVARPWRIEMKQLQALRQSAGTPGGVPGGAAGPQRGTTAATLATVRLMAHMLERDSHPYTTRCIAQSLRMSDIAQWAEPLDPLYQLMGKLSALDDLGTRRMMISALDEVDPATPASISLLKLTARDSDPVIQLQALRSLLRVSRNDPGQFNEAVAAANQFLNSAQGVMPHKVLAELLDLADQNPDVEGQLVGGIIFESLRGARRDRAVAYIISQADDRPLASGWLDLRLLGSPQPSLVLRTLEVLESAHIGQAVFEPALVSLLAAWLGPADSSAQTQQMPEVALTGPIAILSTRHNLFRALQSGNLRARDLAWRSLRNFTFVDEPVRGVTPDRDLTEPYMLLVDAALSQPDTPPQAVYFLAGQTEDARSTPALVDLVIGSSPRVSAMAARVLAGSGRELDRALTSSSYQERAASRQAFAEAMYRAFKLAPPKAAALIRHQSSANGIVHWFGQWVAQNTLPPGRKLWAKAFGDENSLLDIVASGTDDELVMAAIDALVADAGGDVRMAQVVYTDLKRKGTLSRAQLLSSWQNHRRSLFLERIKEVTGPRRLLLHIYPRGAGGLEPTLDIAGPAAAVLLRPGFPILPARAVRLPAPKLGKPQQTLNLGNVVLQVNGDQITFGTAQIKLTVPDDQLGIRFKKVSELRHLANPQVNKLPLDKVRDSIYLLPQDDGSWRGQVVLPNPDGRIIELVMQPITSGRNDK